MSAPTRNLIERAIGAVKDFFWKPKNQYTTPYDGAEQWSKKRGYKFRTHQDAYRDLDETSRVEMVRKARDKERNFFLPNRLCDLFELYTVGANGTPLIPASTDSEWNERARAWWDQWCKVCDISTLQTFSTIQSLVARNWFIDGEHFLIKAYETNGPTPWPRLQLIESHRVATPPKKVAGTIIDGAQVDPMTGRPMAWWISRDVAGEKWEPIKASDVIHVFEPSRPLQFRGITFFYPVINLMSDLEDIKILEVQAAKDLARVVRTINSAGGQHSSEDAYREEVVRTDGVTRSKYYEEIMEAGTTILAPGDVFKQEASNRPSVVTQQYYDTIVAEICAGVGIDAQLVFPKSIQGTVARGGLDISAQFFRARSAVLAGYWTDIYQWVIGWAIQHDSRLKGAPKDWWRVSVKAPRSVNVDVGRNSAAMLSELAAGATTLQRIYSDLGEDWTVQLDQVGREAKAIRDIAAKYGVDPQEIRERAVAKAAEPDPKSEADDTPPEPTKKGTPDE